MKKRSIQEAIRLKRLLSVLLLLCLLVGCAVQPAEETTAEPEQTQTHEFNLNQQTHQTPKGFGLAYVEVNPFHDTAMVRFNTINSTFLIFFYVRRVRCPTYTSNLADFL